MNCRSTSPGSEANDDVVHCVCSDNTDEGFMIQVPHGGYDYVTNTELFALALSLPLLYIFYGYGVGKNKK